MLFIKKYRYVIIAMVALLAIFYWLIEGGTISQNKPFEDIKRPNAIIKDSKLNEDKDGKKVWELNAEIIEIDSETGVNKLTGVKGKLYRVDGTTITVTSKEGTYNPGTKHITLSGDVLAVYSEGWTLKCQFIEWIPEKNLILARDKVEVDKKDLYLAGDEMQTDPDLGKIEITGNGIVKKRS